MKKALQKCSQCKREKYEESLVIIDEKPVCLQCLYGQTKPFQIYPIGKVHLTDKKEISYIKLLPSQRRFLYKLEEEENITIVYYLHKSNFVRSTFNRGLDRKKVGVFASRTPHRLSKIAIQDVTLIKVDGTTLVVEGLDAFEDSPVLDIKLMLRS